MIVEYYGIKVEIPKFQFGNETDIQINKKMSEISKMMDKNIPNKEAKVKMEVESLKSLIAYRNKQQH